VRVGMDEFCFPILCHAESVAQELGREMMAGPPEEVVPENPAVD
jgi:hypothetical protein